jgi:hypothetical protein
MKHFGLLRIRREEHAARARCAAGDGAAEGILDLVERAGGRDSSDARGARHQLREATTFDPSDFRNTVPPFNPENRKPNHAIVDLVKRIATEKNVTPAQIALG